MKNLLFLFLFCPLSIAAQDFDCLDFHCSDFDTGTGGCEEKAEKPFLYPNPTTDICRVEGSYTEGVLYAVNGQFLRRVDTRKDVDISDLASGVYFLRLENFIFKIVKI